jgi:hypothetical protein
LASFLPVPVDGRALTGHDGVVRWYQVPIDGYNVAGHGETVQLASKKQGIIRQLAESAGRPIDSVSVAGFVQRWNHDACKLTKFLFQDEVVKVWCKNCDNLSRKAGSLLPQPSVLAFVQILKLYHAKNLSR